MNYETLLNTADTEELLVKEKPLKYNIGRIYGNRVAIRKDMPTVQKACALAEELGHYYTSYGDIIELHSIENQKQELRARLWAYNKMIGLQGIIAAYKHGCTLLHDMAEFLEVTEEFLAEALERYRSKYGCYTKLDNYVIYFEPVLGVLEMI